MVKLATQRVRAYVRHDDSGITAVRSYTRVVSWRKRKDFSIQDVPYSLPDDARGNVTEMAVDSNGKVQAVVTLVRGEKHEVLGGIGRRALFVRGADDRFRQYPGAFSTGKVRKVAEGELARIAADRKS